MNVFVVSSFAALIGNFITGLSVFLANTKRTTNQHFFTMSLIIGGWLCCFAFGSLVTDEGKIEFVIRASNVWMALLPPAFSLLRLSIINPEKSWGQVLYQARVWFLFATLAASLCFTDFFLRGAIMAHPVAEPVYGPGLAPYMAYFVIGLIVMITQYIKDVRKGAGIQRMELQYALFGCAAAFCFPVMIGLIVLVTKTAQSVQVVPLSIIILDVIIAYGIATRKIMDVADVLRRVIAYGLLTIYLITLYLLVWGSMNFLLTDALRASPLVPHILAALAMSFSLAPSHGFMQRFANNLFIKRHTIDVGVTMKNAGIVLQSISTLDELLKNFSFVIAESMGTDDIQILLTEGESLVQKYPANTSNGLLTLKRSDPICQTLQVMREPLVLDAVERMHPTPQIRAVSHKMQTLHIAVAIGIRGKNDLDGLVLLGPRISRRVYVAAEQDTLQLLCNQFSVALENSTLYTQVQDGKIYNEILLDNLLSGVVAANAEKIVTIFNREAQRITDLTRDDVVGKPIDCLPLPLVKAMEAIHESGEDLRDEEASIPKGNIEDIPIRIGGTNFRGHEGIILGSLLIFTDLTSIKELETQVRRTDRLASVGTLAAGMAHEIKNPLVTIKTFTQLLPERYADEDFRNTFSDLLGHEVQRIDGLVNQLLNFSRPTKPHLTPTSLHEILDHGMKLIGEQLKPKNISLIRTLDAPHDTINADSGMLEQAVVNFLLNALESMDSPGRLTVSTGLYEVHDSSGPEWGDPIKTIQVRIQDTGKGINKEDLTRIFDPFFTTKSEGTGLGLAVSHDIIIEHGGILDVESEVGRGTLFKISFPLVREEAAV